MFERVALELCVALDLTEVMTVRSRIPTTARELRAEADLIVAELRLIREVRKMGRARTESTANWIMAHGLPDPTSLRSFTAKVVSCTTIDQVRFLITLTSKKLFAVQMRRRDLASQQHLRALWTARNLAAKRQAGRMLEAGMLHPTVGKFSNAAVIEWRRLAHLDVAAMLAQVDSEVQRCARQCSSGSTPLPQIVMRASPWEVLSNGTRRRTIYAVDEAAA
jgi:hypothetical protein